MPKTRPEDHKGQTVVFVPFPKSRLGDTLSSTSGGLSQMMKESLRKYEYELEELKKKPASNASKIKSRQALIDRYNAASAPAWGNVIAEDIITTDDDYSSRLSRLNGPHDMLYIRGHGGQGLSYICGDDMEIPLNYEDLADLLSSVPKSFEGIIKIYSCFSSLSSEGWFLGGDSFCQKFADEMFGRGYNKCTYYGYIDELKLFSLPSGHKTDSSRVSRASSRRVQVIPEPKPAPGGPAK